MLAIVSLLVIVVLSLLVTRVAAVALVHTGLGQESARFQARSAFSGVGFTTSEAEAVVAHPVRRRIVMWLMLVGNVGIVAGVSSLLLSFIDLDRAGGVAVLAVLAAGLMVLGVFASSQRVDQILCRAISGALQRWTSIDARDYARLLHLRDDYGVSELRVEATDWLAGKTLGESSLDLEGLLVLGIECPGGYFIGAPTADVAMQADDRLILYGRTPRIAELDQRDATADAAARHAEAAAERRVLLDRERASAGR